VLRPRELILKCYGLVAGPTLAAYLVGMFWRRANARGANCGLIAGLAFSFGAEFLPLLTRIDAIGYSRNPVVALVSSVLTSVQSVNHHHRALFAFFLSVAVVMVVSLLGQAPEPERLERTTFAWYRKRRREIEDLAATPDDHEGEPLRDPFYLDYRIWSILLLILLLVVWWVFGLPRVWTEFIPGWFRWIWTDVIPAWLKG